MNNLEDTNSTIGFGADEMVVCKKCNRRIPPNRTECIYCGNKIELSEIQLDSVKLSIKKPENFENGYNLILRMPNRELQSFELKSVSSMLGLETELLKKIFEVNETLPCARLLSRDDSEVAIRKIIALNVNAEVVADESFRLKEPPQRLRRLEINDNRVIFTLFNSGESIEIHRDDLILIVIGSIFEKKIETVEKYSKKKENKQLSAIESACDEKVIDIYDGSNLIGYRIFTHGFDFSCLEAEMSFLAVENIKKLFVKLGEIGPNVVAIDTYDEIRYLLGEIWEVEAVSDLRSVEKKGVGKFNRNRAIKYSNLGQFTRFSRLKRHLI